MNQEEEKEETGYHNKSNNDETRLDACDKVSVTNKKRNDLVENIDFIINNRC